MPFAYVTGLNLVLANHLGWQQEGIEYSSRPARSWRATAPVHEPGQALRIADPAWSGALPAALQLLPRLLLSPCCWRPL